MGRLTPTAHANRIPERGSSLSEARDLLSDALGGRPDFEGFAAALRGEAEWLHAMERADGQSRESDGRRLLDLADAVEETARRLGFL